MKLAAILYTMSSFISMAKVKKASKNEITRDGTRTVLLLRGERLAVFTLISHKIQYRTLSIEAFPLSPFVL